MKRGQKKMPFEANSQMSVKDILSNPNTFATTMLLCVIDQYGTDVLSWSPQTILMETEEDFGFKWPPANFDRLMAGIAVLITDRFYKSLPDFIEICNILAGSPASPGVFDPADTTECAWGITEALLLSPPDDNDREPFIEEIRAYIGKVLEAEGIINPPDILRIGIIGMDKRYKVHNDFSDDPEMYNAIWDTEASKTQDINELTKDRLFLLVNQLELLQLKNGSTTEIAKKMLQNLSSTPRKGSPLQ
jgi:hypothetical protein